jgi:hypothetical protein
MRLLTLSLTVSVANEKRRRRGRRKSLQFRLLQEPPGGFEPSTYALRMRRNNDGSALPNSDLRNAENDPCRESCHDGVAAFVKRIEEATTSQLTSILPMLHGILAQLPQR